MNLRSSLTRYEKILVALFVASLPFVNPWVRGDGVGYYSYARALIVNHNLQFEQDWLNANQSFRNGRVDAQGRIRPEQYTSTGHLDDHFTIGPALIWMPFLAITHAAILGAKHLGASIPANGFSKPYLDTMAVVTALAGFAGLFFSFRLARKYFPERWAFLATLGIWFASSLPVYMYFNPSWSHAQSAFVVALFLWYWDRTRDSRTSWQWFVLGLIGGLMMDMYYPNTIFFAVLGVEIGIVCWHRVRQKTLPQVDSRVSLQRVLLFSVAVVLAFSPTLFTRWIIYGSPFATGYTELGVWHLGNPLWRQVLFSTDHGLFSWTPILLLASVGLLLLCRRDPTLGAGLIASAGAFYFLIATYPDWDGISSFGNRFFVSLTPIFILGLTALLAAYEKVWSNTKVALSSAFVAIALFVAWNFGLMFQWGMHLIPDRGPVSWEQMVSNQFRTVPTEASQSLERYFTGRQRMMQSIEKKDLDQLRQSRPAHDRPTDKK